MLAAICQPNKWGRSISTVKNHILTSPPSVDASSLHFFMVHTKKRTHTHRERENPTDSHANQPTQLNEMPHEITIKLKMKCIYENTDAIVSFILLGSLFLSSFKMALWLDRQIWNTYNNYSYFGERTKNEEEKKHTHPTPNAWWIKKRRQRQKSKTKNEVWIRNGGTGRMHIVYMCPLKKRHQTVKGECKLHFEIGFNLKILGSFWAYTHVSCSSLGFWHWINNCHSSCYRSSVAFSLYFNRKPFRAHQKPFMKYLTSNYYHSKLHF